MGPDAGRILPRHQIFICNLMVLTYITIFLLLPITGQTALPTLRSGSVRLPQS
jgi:hypothetical protein